jgi:6-pyruvoyltetrahydropterin/6-carboxytetrahydropterin synthase
MITLTRRYRFSASHRLHVPSLGDERNAELFGKCNNPFGHGHNYVLSVTVEGEIDEQTGLIIHTGRLDRLVETKVLKLLAHRNLNADVPQFSELVPTTENLALVIAGLLENEWAEWFPVESGARLWRVHVQETDRNGFEVLLSHPPRPFVIRNQESTAVHV